MDAFTDVFNHNPSCGIIICRACAFAVPPKHIVTHLKRHPRVPVPKRRVIEAAARELRNLAWEQKDLRLPLVAEAPIPGFVNGTNGLVCQWEGCMYTCTTKQRITTHCKEQHGWTNEQRRGGDVRNKSTQLANQLWAEGQPYQRVFRAGGWPAYVALRAPAVAAVSQRSADDLYEQVKAERRRIEEEEAAAAAKDTIREGRRHVPNPWLELTGWPSHLKGRERAALLSARLPPVDPPAEAAGEGEVALQRACDAMRRLVRSAFQTCRAEVAGRPALEVIERRETGANSNEKPFYSHQKANTIKRYSNKVVGVLCYV